MTGVGLGSVWRKQFRFWKFSRLEAYVGSGRLKELGGYLRFGKSSVI